MRISDWSSDVCSSDLVVITGAAGFLGQRLTTQLLAAGQLTDRDGRIRAIDQLVLADIVAAPDPGDARVRVVTGDLGVPGILHEVIDTQTESIFPLAAGVSGKAMAEIEAGLAGNLDRT